MFSEHLLWAWRDSRCWAHVGEQNGQRPCPSPVARSLPWNKGGRRDGELTHGEDASVEVPGCMFRSHAGCVGSISLLLTSRHLTSLWMSPEFSMDPGENFTDLRTLVTHLLPAWWHWRWVIFPFLRVGPW